MRKERLGGLDARIVGGSDGRGGGDGPVVVLLHGFGAPGDDLVPLGSALALPAPVRFVFPAAPLVLGGFGPFEARAWWPIDMARFEEALLSGRTRDLASEVPEGLAPARARMEELLLEVERRLGAGPLILGGFSQGAMLSCELALRSALPLRGLVLLSGTFLCEHEWRPLFGRRAGLRVFQSHGTLDPLLPYDLAERLRDAWRAGGAEVDWVSFEGAHEIGPLVLARLRAFLSDVARGAAPPAPPSTLRRP